MYYNGIFMEALRKTTKALRIAGLWVEIRTRDFPNTKQEC
jgi:hypothetical protein